MAPDPRLDRNDQVASGVGGFGVTIDVDDDETSEVSHEGYSLFLSSSDGLIHEYIAGESEDDEEDDDDDDDDNGSDISQIEIASGPYRQEDSSELRGEFASLGSNDEAEEVPGSARLCTRQDIKIDCEEIKAAMANITLPASSIPEWANGMSDSVLSNHIKSLTQKNGTDSSSR